MKHRLHVSAAMVLSTLVGGLMATGKLRDALQRIGVSSTNYRLSIENGHTMIAFRYQKHCKAVRGYMADNRR